MSRGGNREGAGRKGGWKNSETQVIRVPKILAAYILEYARKIDSGELERLSFSKSLDIFSSVTLTNESVAEPLSSVLDSVTDSSSSVLDSVTDSSSSVLDSVTDSLSSVLDSVTDSLSSVLDSVTEPLSPALESVTESSNLVLDFVTDSKIPPSKPDGKRWLSSEQAWNIAGERGCDRNLQGFRSWSKRHPDECLALFSLRRLESIRGRTSSPAFENFRHNQDPDCQDF